MDDSAHISEVAAKVMQILPIGWAIAAVLALYREDMFYWWFMPFVGLAGAMLSNAVPVGGGVVFIPTLHLIGTVQHHQSVAFSVATQSMSNGVFGLLAWLKKDPNAIRWELLPFTVIPAQVAYVIVNYYLPGHLLHPSHCRILMATYSLAVAMFVFTMYRQGGLDEAMRKARTYKSTEMARFSRMSGEDGKDIPEPPEAGRAEGNAEPLKLPPANVLVLVSICCFVDGWVLVANLGVGNSLTSFLVLVVLAGVDTQSALVTGIVTGGWTAMVAFAVQVHKGNLLLPLWLMGLPGTYVGASVAPAVNKALGPQRVQLFFGIFLCISAAVLISTSWRHAAETFGFVEPEQG